MRAPIPVHEHERLQALHGLRVLDSDVDPRFDDIVSRAAALCGVPMAAITLIDAERQWTKAAVGLVAREIPRDGALCAHTVLGSSVLIVPDMLDDPRFRDHELVVGPPQVRFYAGAPLLSTDGLAVGALCVLDHVTRTIEPWQVEVLEMLARQATALMRLGAIERDHADALDDLELARRNLSYLTTHDALTGLCNRQTFVRAVEAVVAANRAGTESPALVMVDIDHFKDVNDELGHDAGDRVLITVADRIHLGCRGDDLVARLASDQFVVLMRSASALGPESLARRLLQSIAAPVDFHGATVSVTASIGIAKWDAGTRSAADLMRDAQRAVRAAKAGGRNRWADATDGSATGWSGSRDPATLVRRAVENRTLRLEHSPLWSLGDGHRVALEAHVQWDAVGPGVQRAAFVAAARELNLTGEIARFTIEEACRAAARRRATGEIDAAVSIEVAAVQLERDEMLLAVAAALTDADLDPSGLVLQLTDSAALVSSASARATLRELQNMGVRVVLGDVGSGFSSFGLLSTFPFDFLKIDAGLVPAPSGADREVLWSLVHLADTLGMVIVVAGAEAPSMPAPPVRTSSSATR